MKKYTVSELANLTGVSTKTIRYYDDINLFKPLERSETGYRYYSIAEAQKLQYIVTFRMMGFSIMEIREILEEEIDVIHAAKLQLKALEKQIQSLHRIQVLLETAITDNSLQSPTFITEIGEELKMTEQQRMDTLIDQFRHAMLRKSCSKEWAKKVFHKHEEMLRNLKLDTKEKMDAFYNLKNLLSDPEFIRETQDSMGDFWNMVKEHQISPIEWEKDMEELFKRAKKASDEGLTYDSLELQDMVDEWMTIISKNIQKPIDQTFITIFKEKVDKMYGSDKQKQYWKALSILDSQSNAAHQATKLMINALEYKLKEMC